MLYQLLILRAVVFVILIMFLLSCNSNTSKRIPRFDVSQAKVVPRNIRTDIGINKSYAIDTCGDMIVEQGGSMLFYNQPSGVYYKGLHSRTYLAWLNTDKTIRATYYDDNTKRIFQYVNLFKWGNLDDHAQPVLHVMKHGKYAGHIIVLLNPHNGALMYARSKRPESIIGFTEMSTIDSGDCNYPSVIENEKGQLLVFYNRNIGSTRPVYFRRSDDGGDTWSAEVELVNFGKDKWVYYIKPVHSDDTIHLAFSVRQPGHDIVKHVYYMKSQDWGMTWIDEGAPVSLPVDTLTAIYSSPDSLQTRVWDIALDEHKQPVIAYVNYDSLYGSSYIAYKHDNSWRHYFVAECKNSYYPPGIVIDDKNTSVVYTNQSVRKHYASVAEMNLDKVSQTFKTTRIISGDTSRNQMHPQMIDNYNQMKLLWVDELYYNSSSDYETNLKAYIAE